MPNSKARIYRKKDPETQAPVGSYYGWWYPDLGAPAKYVCLQTRDRRAAEARLAAIEREACVARANRTPDQAAGPDLYSLTDALTDYLERGCLELAKGTLNSYMKKARHVLRVLGDIDIHELDRDATEDYVAQRLEEGAIQGTIYKEVVVLRQALKYAKTKKKWFGEVDEVVVNVKNKYVPRKRYLTEAELARLLEQVSPDRQLWVVLAVYLGARRSVLEALDWDHVDLARGVIEVPGTKTAASAREVPIHGSLREWLEATPVKRGKLVLAWSNCTRDLAAACERAGMKPVTANDLRRTFISFMKQAGQDSLVVARLAGTSQKMVEVVYAQLDQATHRRAIATLPSLPSRQPGSASVVTPRTVAQSSATSARVRATRKTKQKTPQPDAAGSSRVPRDGIEPPTRGFSVPCSTN
jgi:integrase